MPRNDLNGKSGFAYSESLIDLGEKIIVYYNKLKINPMTKTIVFSDGLTIKEAIRIYDHFKGRILVSFRIKRNPEQTYVPWCISCVIESKGK